MKAVLMSIKPKWVELIISGEKTVEVRKTAPKLQTPFKVYVYETRGTSETPIVYEDGYMDFHGRGKVIGEFVCDGVMQYNCDRYFQQHFVAGYIGAYMPLREMCLTQEDLFEYGKGKTLYGWHISDLKIYDKQKGLSEFFKACDTGNKVVCSNCNKRFDRVCNGRKHINRAPQSWCYIEKIEV